MREVVLLGSCRKLALLFLKSTLHNAVEVLDTVPQLQIYLLEPLNIFVFDQRIVLADTTCKLVKLLIILTHVDAVIQSWLRLLLGLDRFLLHSDFSENFNLF